MSTPVAADAEVLTHYAIYANTLDFPGWFVVRPWQISAGDAEPNPVACLCSTLEEAREPFRRAGLFRLARFAEDDPVLVEVWL